MFGLVITLAAVISYSSYIGVQIVGLRRLQNDLVDRSRRDTLQLLRIQNDLNLLGIAMRDMLDNAEPYPLSAWSPEFQRIQQDLNDALRKRHNKVESRLQNLRFDTAECGDYPDVSSLHRARRGEDANDEQCRDNGGCPEPPPPNPRSS